jgi:hypothetical protein
MIKVIKKLTKTDKYKNKIYEEEEELIDHEDGNLTEAKKEFYQGSPLEKTTFEQFLILEREKNHLLQTGAPEKLSGISIIKHYIEIKAYKRLKALQKKLLGE